MKGDLELVQEARGGDREAFSELVRRHQKMMLRLALRMTRQWDLAEDIVQESFIKAYRGLAGFGERSSFRSWLYQITINTARNKLRGKPYDMIRVDLIEIGVGAVADAELEARSVRQIIQSEVDGLPERQRMAVTLRVFEDLSFKEIAEIMQCPYDTAKANYRHGLLKLRERFQSIMSNGSALQHERDVWVEYAARTAEVES